MSPCIGLPPRCIRRSVGPKATVAALIATPSPSRRTLALLVTPIVVFVVMGLVANALAPTLLAEHPLLLIVLDARNRNLLAVSNLVDLLPFVVVGVTRRVLSDPLFFLLGRFYGDRALRWAERRLGGSRLLVAVTEQGFRRASAVMVFLFPGALVCVLAGVARMKVWVFFALNLAGTVSAVITLRVLGRVLREPIDAVLDFNQRNVKWLTALTV